MDLHNCNVCGEYNMTAVEAKSHLCKQMKCDDCGDLYRNIMHFCDQCKCGNWIEKSEIKKHLSECGSGIIFDIIFDIGTCKTNCVNLKKCICSDEIFTPAQVLMSDFKFFEIHVEKCPRGIVYRDNFFYCWCCRKQMQMSWNEFIDHVTSIDHIPQDECHDTCSCGTEFDSFRNLTIHLLSCSTQFKVDLKHHCFINNCLLTFDEYSEISNPDIVLKWN